MRTDAFEDAPVRPAFKAAMPARPVSRGENQADRRDEAIESQASVYYGTIEYRGLLLNVFNIPAGWRVAVTKTAIRSENSMRRRMRPWMAPSKRPNAGRIRPSSAIRRMNKPSRGSPVFGGPRLSERRDRRKGPIPHQCGPAPSRAST
jgi:hypothetical protein